MPIAYSDGSEEEVLSILESAADLSSTSLNSHERYSAWPIRYHLCPERSNLLRHLDFSGLDVLELGAGMGGASRFIAENSRSFVGVEGSETRAAGLCARLRDLAGCEVVVANIQDYRTDRRFNVVCLIGVLEYSELYIDPPGGVSPFEWTLRHAASMLKPGGQLVVAIENQIGVKYWAGAAEDHTGRMFDGVCGYPPGKTARTFSRKALLELCRAAGLPEVEEFYPWPDYKTPSSIVGRELVDRFPMIAADMAADAVAHEQEQLRTGFPWALAARQVAAAGLLDEFADSFLFVAGPAGSSTDKGGLLRNVRNERECAWHYSIVRREPIRTALIVDDEDDAKPMVAKRALPDLGAPSGPVQYETVRRNGSPPVPVLLDRPVVDALRRLAYADDSEGFVLELERFMRWAMEAYALDEGHVRPVALDLTSSNAVGAGDTYEPFDIGWELLEPLPKSWFIFRNLLVIRSAVALFATPPHRSIGEWYISLCGSFGIEPDLAGDIDREARMQADIQRNMTFEISRESLRTIFLDRVPPAPYPKDPQVAFRHRKLPADGSSLAKRLVRVLRSPRALAQAVGRRLLRGARTVAVVLSRQP